MIGQKRRQPSTVDDAGAGRPRAVSVSAGSTSSSDDERGSLSFWNISRPSWLRRKFWRSKNAKEHNNVDSLPTNQTSSSRTASATSSSAASDFVERQRHRYRRFYRSVIKRSRTADSFERQHADGDRLLMDGYAAPSDEDWKRLEISINRLLERLNEQPDESPAYPDEECVICVTGRASLQTFPCGHKVLCKSCFVRTLQIAFQERQLPLRCVLCRSRIARLKQQPAPSRVVIKQQRDPPGSFYMPQAPSPLPPSGIRRPGYM